MAMGDDACEERLVPVHICWSDEEASLAISYLAVYGIGAFSTSNVSHAVFPGLMDGLGEVKVLVAESDAADAKTLLDSLRPQTTIDEKGPTK